MGHKISVHAWNCESSLRLSALTNLLIYGTGGLAYGNATLGYTNFQGYINADPVTGKINFTDYQYGTEKTNTLRTGWSAGGGLEWMFAPNWSAKAEYVYYDLGYQQNLTPIWVVANPGFGRDGPQRLINTLSQYQTRFNGNIVRAGVNYHLNWANMPVVAKF